MFIFYITLLITLFSNYSTLNIMGNIHMEYYEVYSIWFTPGGLLHEVYQEDNTNA